MVKKKAVPKIKEKAILKVKEKTVDRQSVQSKNQTKQSGV